MTLPSSGSISLGQVRTEISGSGAQSLKTGSEALGESVAPYAMSELYGKSIQVDSLVLNKYFISFDDWGGTEFISVTANVGWSLTKVNTGDGTTWFLISPTSGSENGLFELDCNSNSGGYREGEVLVTNDGTAPNRTVSFGQDGASACFHPDTPITMADWSIKRLGDIVMGEEIMSYKLPGLKDDESNLEGWSMTDKGFDEAYFVPAKVVKLIHGSYHHHYVINDIMKVTFEHHLFVRRRGVWSFRQARRIMAGDYFWDGEKRVLIESVKCFDEAMPMVTMDVEETDVYFAHGVLVHNPIEDPEDPK